MITAHDAQTLVRKMYKAEGLDRTKATLTQKHAVQNLYEVRKVGDRYEAVRK